MHVLITGSAGFLGQRLARQLLADPAVTQLTLVDIVLPAEPIEDERVVTLMADLSDPEAAQRLMAADVTAVYHLAAVVSGQAEADFDLGMAVNCDGTRHLLEAVRHQAPGAIFVFASSLAVFGGQLPETITDRTAVMPQSSYGTQKAISELWVNDYTRKGFIDGRVLRLPTVCVRPGKPNAAASSFVSSIIREPLQGKRAVCPVDIHLPLWLSSPAAVTANLARGLTIPAERFGDSRTVNLPGITVTVQAAIATLSQVAGREAASRINYQLDESISKIVASWPSRFDTSRASQLGFSGDRSFEEIVRTFMAEALP